MSDDQQIVSGQQVYDAIMAEIEADLVSDQLPLLDEKYASESEDEKAVRLKRYEAAFAEYDKRYSEFVRGLNAEVVTMRKEARKEAEIEDSEQAKKTEQALLDQMGRA